MVICIFFFFFALNEVLSPRLKPETHRKYCIDTPGTFNLIRWPAHTLDGLGSTCCCYCREGLLRGLFWLLDTCVHFHFESRFEVHSMLRKKGGWVSERGGWRLVTVPTVQAQQTLPGPSLALFPKLVGCQERHVVTGVWAKSKGISCQLCMSGMSCVGGDGDCDPFTPVLCIEFWGASGWCVHFLKHWEIWRKNYTICEVILIPLNFEASRQWIQCSHRGRLPCVTSRVYSENLSWFHTIPTQCHLVPVTVA